MLGVQHPPFLLLNYLLADGYCQCEARQKAGHCFGFLLRHCYLVTSPSQKSPAKKVPGSACTIPPTPTGHANTRPARHGGLPPSTTWELHPVEPHHRPYPVAGAGESPTLANVRKTLGGGSYTTISEAMNEWKAKQQAASSPMREPAPEAITSRLHDLGADIWAVALDMANARLTSEREALETTRQQLENAQQEATELADQLSAELEALQANYKEAVNDLQEARTHLDQANRERVTLTRQLATTEARAEETTKRADDLKAELQHAHQENTAQRQRHSQERQALKADLAASAEALKTRSAETARLDAELTQAKAHAAHLQQQHQTQQERSAAELQQIGERLTQAQTDKEQAQQAASASRETAAQLRGELEALRTQNAALLASLTAPAKDGKDKP